MERYENNCVEISKNMNKKTCKLDLIWSFSKQCRVASRVFLLCYLCQTGNTTFGPQSSAFEQKTIQGQHNPYPLDNPTRPMQIKEGSVLKLNVDKHEDIK